MQTLTEPICFKKYANRRLYNLSESKYVTLEDISKLICEGREVRVIDAKTEVDVTAFTLTQIVLEQAKNKNILLPVPFLHLIIRNGGNILPQFFENQFKQFSQSLDIFTR